MKFYNYINEQETIDWKSIVSGNFELQRAVEIMEIISKLGYEILIVGGFVRDVILGIPSHDIDLTTNMPPKEIEKHFENFDIGKNKIFGVTVVKYKGYTYEISNYRADLYSSLEGSKGAEKVELVNNFKEDSARRDFTINSLGIDYKGNIIDHHGGSKDLKMKKVTAVGDPKLRFKEDAIRMMRGVRAAAKLGFDIDPNTKDAIKKQREDLRKIAPERIKDELVKMASQTGERFAKAIVLLDDVGILDIILPEITKLKEYKEKQEHHPEAYEFGEGRVYDHVLAAIRKNKLENPLINLGILFHDVGKGLGYEGGPNRFYRHAEKSKDIIDGIAKRLKLSNKERDSILFSALNHMKMNNALDMKATKIMKLVNDENWEVLKAVSYCDDACRLHFWDKKRFTNIITNMEKIAKKWGQKFTSKANKIVDGKIVMDITGLAPSKKVGEIIDKVTDILVNQGSKEDIEDIIKRVYSELK